MQRLFIMALLTFALAIGLSACGQLNEDVLTIRTADQGLTLHFRLLPALVPLPTITPNVNPCIDVKANINANGERIYHLPGQANYNNVVIDEAAGERIFCTEQDAIDAGFRKSLR